MSFMCGCDADNDFQTSTTQMARKPYQCGECRQNIKPGDTYRRIFTVFDGSGSTHRVCERCDDLMAAFEAVGYCYYLGEFLTSYAEWLDEEGKVRPAWLNAIIKPPLHVITARSE